MKHQPPLWLLLLGLSRLPAMAAVDTLKSTSEIEDCVIYSWDNCDPEASDEDCRRYNAGTILLLGVGQSDLAEARRTLLHFPGWDGTMPDSSRLLLYAKTESDGTDRRIFLYPLTVENFEGTEGSHNVGDYPDPDSGATWNHAWLDVGDVDSSTWSTAGGDYTSAVACTMLVTDTNQYFAFDRFERILHYWDTGGQQHGVVLINEDAFPANTSLKSFASSEADVAEVPLLLLYYPDTTAAWRRRRIVNAINDR